MGRRDGRKHALSLLRCEYELSKVVTLGPESSQSRTVSLFGSKKTLPQWRIEYEPDQQHVSRASKASGLTDAKSVATLATDYAGGPKASQISELRRTAKWTILRKMKSAPECSSEIQLLCIGQVRPLVLGERVDAEDGFTTYTGPLPSRELHDCAEHFADFRRWMKI